ncbi:basement membrane-specific heparan sulfate proteoglycan core protein [Prorops nasuta]|uniref:basement membrane-specific heparan sulfate proteoglycan core protein n=1 Tax=Prorops nasuta TaxID=863751 RepID=UPI0034CD1051
MLRLPHSDASSEKKGRKKLDDLEFMPLELCSKNDDLVFDQESKSPGNQVPLIEKHDTDSFLQRIKRWGLADSWIPSFLSFDSSTTPPGTTESDNATERSKRVERQSGEENNEIEDEPDIGKTSEAHFASPSYGNSDDEDLAGSGEIEGSATETDLIRPVTESQKIGGEPRFYRITLIVGEPFRKEYEDRSSPEYRELSGNLTHALEELYNQHIPNHNHLAYVVMISPTNDKFASQVSLDIGSTFTNEREVRAVLEEQLQYHLLGNIQVRPEGFTFRNSQGTSSMEADDCDLSIELKCKDGTCIPLEYRCDGHRQCNDGSDELDCPTGFPEHHLDDYEEETATPRPPANKCRADDVVRCSDGSRYICSIQKCDGTPDCDDASDEHNCPHPGCSSGEFACDVSRCILEYQRCNFVQDCQDGSDEHDCNYPACSLSQYKCKNGECIDSKRRCDGSPDCRDRSDEQNCPCKENQLECSPGICLPLSRRCDGVVDCNNGNDEKNCTRMTRCRQDEFECGGDGECVSKSARCDGRRDCIDNSDEQHCNVTTCSGDQFRCLDGTCLSIELRCNGAPDCTNGDDELQCGCGPDEFKCNDGRCIRFGLRCNGIADCMDHSDEQNCGLPPCSPMDFTCGDGSCIPKESVCDGFDNCPRAEDELYCDRECTPTQFKCATGNKCIEDTYRCDGHADCPDHSDENCQPLANQTNTQPCADGYLPCDNGVCISKNFFCDNSYDCHDESDEKNCPGTSGGGSGEKEPHRNCNGDEFTCSDGTCLPRSALCNGRRDCPRGEDETNCHRGESSSPSFNILTKFHDTERNIEPLPTNLSTARICAPDDFLCADGTCIPNSHHCDHFYDCRDFTDEQYCFGCSRDQFQCGNGDCIRLSQRCDGYVNCDDGSDENCDETSTEGHVGAGSDPVPGRHCSASEFTCISDRTCIPFTSYCNGVIECRDASDEHGCVPDDYTEVCSDSEWKCESGQCIPSEMRCNQHIDCPYDDSDEYDCGGNGTSWTTTPSPTPVGGSQVRCQLHEWRCENGQCIPSHQRCDKRIDCPDDMSDELDCTYRNQTSGGESGFDLRTYPSEQVIKQNPAKEGREVVFQCRDEGPLRAKVHWIRSNNLPLPPGSRDLNGRLEIPNIQLDHAGTYVCEALGYPPSTPGRQLSVFLTVEKFEVPSTRPPKVCQYDESTCSNGECISKLQVCNGKFDCTDGSDELRCSPHGCEPNEFRCQNTQCVSKLWRCDGEKDCVDGSDEENCTPQPGSACRYSEFQCARGDQCIPKTYQCDLENDCFDGSDEVGCSPVYIVKPPEPMLILAPGETMVITCSAVGVPTPEINWRLNWGHIHSKCNTSSVNGTGTLVCPDIQEEDQGAYSCEALNLSGFVIAVPDTILVVKKETTVCPAGKFNSEARQESDCIGCFCFGVATSCSSANLFTYNIPPPTYRHNVLQVQTYPNLAVRSDLGQVVEARASGRNGILIQEMSSGIRNDPTTATDNLPYYALPEVYHGNQLKSYGGYLKYNIRYSGNGTINRSPSVILTGNNYILVHHGNQLSSDHESTESVRFFYGDWYKVQGRSEILASREDIMMTLANVDNILIKAKYDDSPQLDIRINNIILDTADSRNTGLGSANFVEECECPTGYTGLSCEHCAPGFLRRENGPWLGQCYRDEPQSCPPGYYGDPSRNIRCLICPCPLTNPANQFARVCHLGSDGQPTCDCPAGYVGRRCERCADGYQGNPLVPGDMCVPVQQCDAQGSLSSIADQSGRCRCKQYTTGDTCNQCKPNTFNLASSNQFGCISCFCMGITNRCVSSNWYRNQIRVSFTNSVRDFSLIESKTPDSSPIVDGIRLDTITREIIYDHFPNRGNNDVYYWQLPSIFLGDQITAYGGNLSYTVRYVPSPGGQSSRNNAADVELISSNDINLLYYSRESKDSLEPNSPISFVVPLFEQFWQRTDGTQADREHLLMALADIRAIRIKATYTTHTDQAALSSVSLDTAERFNTGRARAVQVEECSCPAGYRGLSCEDCDVGYTRAIEGLYLGICEPCNCNGHSKQCDPETGICENCADHTTGDFCEVCEAGYAGDAKRGSPYDCQPGNETDTTESCNCNEAGSLSRYCVSGRCECKRNVEGPECNRCRPATFGLSTANVDGCNECHCSGVTDQCHESSLYIQQIPVGIYDSQHGFTLTDSSRREVIDEGFEINLALNEIGYRYSDNRARRLYWSLPAVFTGNKVKSYAGKLTLTQHISAHYGATNYKDQDIILIGNGITLFWTNPEDIEPDTPLTYSVELRESEWNRLAPEGPRRASRTDMMTVLSNLEAILVRATHSDKMSATYISDISMDTAVENPTGNSRAIQVEACRCPVGYSGTSCEICSRGYYRDTSDRSISFLGSCNSCPCNNNEESCEIGRTGQIKCHCLPGYTGEFCQDFVSARPTTPAIPTIVPPKIVVSIQEPEFQIVQTGDNIRYHCTGKSLDLNSVNIRWQKDGGQLPPGRSIDDHQGLLVIRDLKVSDSGVYVCQVSDGVNVGIKKVTLSVGAFPQSLLGISGSNQVEPRVIIRPTYLQVKEGEPVEFNCEASGNPPPQVEWIRLHGNMSPEAQFHNGIWRLPAASKSDEAEYKCIARSELGEDEKTTILYVQDNPNKPGATSNTLIITPAEYEGLAGDTLRLHCTSSQRGNISWTRGGGLHLPHTATESRDGILTITNPTISDSGIYVCIATNYRDTETSKTARVTILPRRDVTTIKVLPERQTIAQGSVAEIKCQTNGGEAGTTITWTKYTDALGPRAQQHDDILRISNVQIADRGVYVCRVSGPSGSHAASAIIEVEPREAPLLELYPKDIQTVLLGGSANLQCRAIAGLPIPEIRWSRQDGRVFSRNIEQLSGGLLRLNNITVEDQGAYVCSAVNTVGSTSMTAHIEVQSIPVISIQPRNGILPVKLGDRIRLVCSAAGHPQPNVAWSKHASDLDAFNLHNLGEATPLSAVYEIYSVSLNDEGSYTCRAINAVGVTEERIQIVIEDDNDVDYPPCRGDQPCDTGNAPTPHRQHTEHRDPHGGVLIPGDHLRIPNGGKVEIRCRVEATNNEHIYVDWKRSDERPLPAGSTVHGGILNIPVVNRSAAGDYVCLGFGPNRAVLFKAKTHLEVISPPRIELNPTRQTVGPGENPSIICRATGDEPLHIEWTAIGRSLPYTVSSSRGVLQFHGITYSDAGKYVCKASNDAGTAEAVAEVLVNEQSYDETSVRAIQRDVSTFAGNSVQLRCDVKDRAEIHWSRDGGYPLPKNARIGDHFLEIQKLKPEDSGRYICQTRSEYGVSSDYINLHVAPTNVPAVNVEISQDPVNIGDTVDIRCSCIGADSPRYQWSRPNHVNLPSNAQEYGNVLRLTNVGVSESGVYRCTAQTHEGNFEEDFNLIIHGGHNDAPDIETKSAPYGSDVEMNCRTELEPPIKFQWNKLGGLLPRDTRTFESILKLTNVKGEDAGTYICTADNGNVNIDIPTMLIVTGVVPNFHQLPQSYIALPPLPDSYLKFSIEVSFRPESYDGLILYNSEYKTHSGDYILLSLVGGYPQFRFDLGSGAATIRAKKSLSLGEWHTVKLQRNRKEATMLVDGEGPYTIMAAGRRQGLDLKDLLYIGGVPAYNISEIAEAGITTGFVGCISKLLIGEKTQDLIGDQLDSTGITTCETCAENPCVNGGVCQEATAKNGYTCLCRAGYSGKHCDYVGQSCYPGACGEGKCVNKETGFDCYCPYQRTGPRCEYSTKINDPAFRDERSFIAHQTPNALRRLKVAMRFNPADNEDGILMYSCQSDEGVGDFAALIIRNGHVEFHYDLGSGVAVVKSDYPIQPEVWSRVTVSRDFKEANLSVNGEADHEGRSPGSARTMTLNTPLYLGGVDRSKVTVTRELEVKKSFRGCINQLEVFGVEKDILKSTIDLANIDDCSALMNVTTMSRSSTTALPTKPPTTSYDSCSMNPCIHGLCSQSSNLYEYSCTCEYGYVGRNCENVLKQCELLVPCRNGGTCTDMHGSYKCDCRLGFNGINCEKLAEVSYDVAFRGDGWLELDRSVMSHEEEREVLGFEISTNKTDGLIMWHGQTPNDLNMDDYIALAVVDGYVEYQYNLGSGPAVMRVIAQKVDDGERHRIILKREGSEGSIELNGEHTESGVSDGLQQILNARGSVYLGGVPDYAMTYGRFQEGFTGCIYTLEVQDSGAIDIGDKAIRGKNVSPCTRARWIPSSLVFTDADVDIFDAFVPPPPVNIIHPKPTINSAVQTFQYPHTYLINFTILRNIICVLTTLYL